MGPDTPEDHMQQSRAPELGDGLAEGPVGLGTHRAVDRRFNDRDGVELVAKHQAEGDKDAVVEAGSVETSSVSAAGFV